MLKEAGTTMRYKEYALLIGTFPGGRKWHQGDRKRAALVLYFTWNCAQLVPEARREITEEDTRLIVDAKDNKPGAGAFRHKKVTLLAA
jgi:hypothetical protein